MSIPRLSIFSSRNGSKEDKFVKGTVLPTHSEYENYFQADSVSVKRDFAEKTKSRDTVQCMDDMGSKGFCKSPSVRISSDTEENGSDKELKEGIGEDISFCELDKSEINYSRQRSKSVNSEIFSAHQLNKSAISEIYSTHQRSKYVISEPMNSPSQSTKTDASKEDKTPQNDPGRPNLPLPPRLREPSYRNPLRLTSSRSFKEGLLGLTSSRSLREASLGGSSSRWNSTMLLPPRSVDQIFEPNEPSARHNVQWVLSKIVKKPKDLSVKLWKKNVELIRKSGKKI